MGRRGSKTSSLLRASSIFSLMTFISRIFGLIRDVIVAQYFGAGAGADAFFVAFKIPNFMRRLFAEGAFSQAFVPLLAEYRHEGDRAALRQLIANISGALGLSLLVLTAFALLLAPYVIRVFAPGFSPDGQRFILATTMLRITFPYLFCISMVACVAAVLNTYRVFGAPAIAPVILNVCLIIAAWYGRTWFAEPIYALAWAVFVAGILQWLFLLPFLYRLNLLVWPSCHLHDPAVRRMLLLMAPALLGASVAQLNLLIDTMFASFLPVGSVSWLYYASRLMNFPLGIFGVALGTVVLPSLSSHFAQQQEKAFSKTLDWGLRSTLMVALPATLGLILLVYPIVTAIFRYGTFNGDDVRQTARALVAFAAGIPAFMLTKVLVSGFYSRQKMRLPVKIAIVALVANVMFSLVFIRPLAHVGLALATSLSAYLNAGMLFFYLYRKNYYVPEKAAWLRYAIQLAVSNLGLSLFLLASYYVVDWYTLTALWRFLGLVALVMASILVYAGLLFFLGVRLKDFRHTDAIEKV